MPLTNSNRGHQALSVALLNRWPDDHVDIACLIFQVRNTTPEAVPDVVAGDQPGYRTKRDYPASQAPFAAGIGQRGLVAQQGQGM